MEDLVERLASLPPALIYLVAAGLLALETGSLIGLTVPAGATLLLVGFLAFEGRLDLGVALVAMITAAAAGDSLAFRAGRRYGPRLRASGLGRRVGEARWRRADELIARHGGRAMMIVRWVAFARTLAPRLAGGSGMPYRCFLPWNLAGVAGWTTTWILAGYAAGESYRRLSAALGQATGAVVVLLAAVAVVALIGRWLGRHHDPVRALAVRVATVPPLRRLRRRYGTALGTLSARVGDGWALVVLNLAAGLTLLFALGLALGWLVAATVAASGLSGLDTLVAQWLAARRTGGAAVAAGWIAGLAHGWPLIVAVAVVAWVRGRHHRPPRHDLMGLLGSAGAFVPLLMLVLVAASTQEPAVHHTLLTAGLGLLAWLVAGGRRWPVAVAIWTVTAAAGLTVVGARLYLGATTVSGTATGVLLGAMWAAVFMVAWATREAQKRRAEREVLV
ncbi:DedA family protein [Catenuloplanes japonicus]|uniref:DedA family protein n=1 Tax=Catenuloplanes japonicus TaxID=33876 RepID=UPI00068E63BF|nr:DedA family protein [Catenuloplanes japonicus]